MLKAGLFTFFYLAVITVIIFKSIKYGTGILLFINIFVAAPKAQIMKKGYQKKFSNGLALPIQHFINQEKSGGIVLGISIVAAMILANSPWHEAYFSFFEQKIGLIFNGSPILYYSLHHWINDGLMSMFFFVVGLELKREFIGGELADIRNTILPIGAAISGMLFPAAIYLALNTGETAGGWGIPMATDIAFSLAILYLLGNKIPLSIKIFLTTLAIVDDLGAVLVIAFFYTSEISLANIGIGVCFLLIMFAANKLGIKSVVFYGIVGIGGVWLAFLMSGIHATIAAVLAALVIPADSRLPETDYIAHAAKLLKRFKGIKPNNVSTLEHEQVEVIDSIIGRSKDAIPPLQRLENAMHPLVSFVIMPVFAIANSGISFIDTNVADIFSTNIAAGTMLGLLIGKPAGIMFATLILIKTGITDRPAFLTTRRIAGIGFLASIGFTMSVFISTLAFNDTNYLLQAKTGIFAASVAGAVIGYKLLNERTRRDIPLLQQQQ